MRSSAAATEHGFLNLIGDDRPDLPEILADILDLDCGAEEKLKITFKIAGCLAGFRGIKAFANEVEDVNLVVLLSVPIHPAVPLLHAVRVPRDFVVDEAMAVVLEIDTLGGCVGGEKDADGGILGIGLEGGFDLLAFIKWHPSIDGEEAVAGGKAFRGKDVV